MYIRAEQFLHIIGHLVERLLTRHTYVYIDSIFLVIISVLILFHTKTCVDMCIHLSWHIIACMKSSHVITLEKSTLRHRVTRTSRACFVLCIVLTGFFFDILFGFLMSYTSPIICLLPVVQDVKCSQILQTCVDILWAMQNSKIIYRGYHQEQEYNCDKGSSWHWLVNHI